MKFNVIINVWFRIFRCRLCLRYAHTFVCRCVVHVFKSIVKRNLPPLKRIVIAKFWELVKKKPKPEITAGKYAFRLNAEPQGLSPLWVQTVDSGQYLRSKFVQE